MRRSPRRHGPGHGQHLLLGGILAFGAQVRDLPRCLLTAGGLCSAQPQACQVWPAHAGASSVQPAPALLAFHAPGDTVYREEGGQAEFSALLRPGSVSPIFMKEVRCPQFSIPPRECLPAEAGCLCVGSAGGVCVYWWGGRLTALHTADRSCLWTLKNPIFFLIATARALSPHSLLVLAEASPYLPPTPASRCLPHGGRRPPSRSPVSGRTIYHVCNREGLGSGPAPAPGSLTKSSFSKADDRLWEQQLELRKEVSPLS